MPTGGYIKIWRKIKNHSYWKEPRKFSKFEAWMDLVMTAAGLDFEVPYRDQVIKLKRGQMIIAERKLAERWQWSRGRVHSFLTNCVHNEEIRYHRKDHRFSIISIVKYSTYNPPAAPRGPTDKTTDKTTRNTTDKTNINKDKRSIKISNKENIYSIIEHWNSQKIKKVEDRESKIRKKTISRTQKQLKDYSVDEICEAISNYSIILKGDKYFFSYSWQLWEFLARGLVNFLTKNEPFKNYLNKKDRGGTKLSYDEQRKKKLDDWEKKPFED